MDQWTKQRLQEDVKRLNDFEKKKLENTEDYRYYVIYKKTREFLVLALSKDKSPDFLKLRYNAPLIREIGVHEFFEYTYCFYGGNIQYCKF